jgi:hypothetical protein
MSGQSNVVYWLEAHGIEPDPPLVEDIFACCKQRDRLLSEQEVMERVRAWRGEASATTPVP